MENRAIILWSCMMMVLSKVVTTIFLMAQAWVVMMLFFVYVTAF
jgi:hypothetical protein